MNFCAPSHYCPIPSSHLPLHHPPIVNILHALVITWQAELVHFFLFAFQFCHQRTVPSLHKNTFYFLSSCMHKLTIFIYRFFLFSPNLSHKRLFCFCFFFPLLGSSQASTLMSVRTMGLVRQLLYHFDILCTSRFYQLWCSSWYIAQFPTSPLVVWLSTLSLWIPLASCGLQAVILYTVSPDELMLQDTQSC